MWSTDENSKIQNTHEIKVGKYRELWIGIDPSKIKIGKSARFGLVQNYSEGPGPPKSRFSLGLKVVVDS